MTQSEKTGDTPQKRRTSNKVLLRRQKMVEIILGDPLDVTARGITEALELMGIKTNESTVAEDLKSPEVAEAMTKALRQFGNSTLNGYALSNIRHKIMVDRDADYSKWWLDKNGFFPSDLERLQEAPLFKAYQESLAAKLVETATAKVVGKVMKGNDEGEGESDNGGAKTIDPTDFIILELELPSGN